MKTPQNLLGLAAVLLVGIYLGSMFNQSASAQNVIGNPLARYQLQTWSANTSRGCYILDTFTGKSWYVEGVNQPQKTSDQLH